MKMADPVIQKINLANIRPLDAVLVTPTFPLNPLASAIRLVSTGWSFNKMFDISVASHVGMVIEIEENLFIAEMKLDGLKINSILEYVQRKFNGDHIVGVRRCPIYEDEIKRNIANDRIIKDAYKQIAYDLESLFKYIFPFLKDCKENYYCSEYVLHQWELDGFIMAEVKNSDDISPYGLQQAKDLITVQIG